MISSPCRNCPKKNQPKDKCMQECKKLNAVQCMMVSMNESGILPGINYDDEDRFTISGGYVSSFSS